MAVPCRQTVIRVLTTLENSEDFKFSQGFFVSVILFFVINPSPVSVMLCITCTQQNFGCCRSAVVRYFCASTSQYTQCGWSGGVILYSSMEFVSSYSHLGHLITDRLDDSRDISQRRNDFVGQVNNVLIVLFSKTMFCCKV